MGVAWYNLHLEMIMLYVNIFQDCIPTLPLASLSHNVICKMGVIRIIITPAVKVK